MSDSALALPPGPLGRSQSQHSMHNTRSGDSLEVDASFLADLPDITPPKQVGIEAATDLLPDLDRLTSTASPRGVLDPNSTLWCGDDKNTLVEPGDTQAERKPWPALPKLWSGRVVMELRKGRGLSWRALEGRETAFFSLTHCDQLASSGHVSLATNAVGETDEWGERLLLPVRDTDLRKNDPSGASRDGDNTMQLLLFSSRGEALGSCQIELPLMEPTPRGGIQTREPQWASLETQMPPTAGMPCLFFSFWSNVLFLGRIQKIRRFKGISKLPCPIPTTA